MKKKLLKKVITASYNNKNELDEDRVTSIATHLTRKDIKEYIRALKQLEKRKQLVVDTSFVPTAKQEEILRERFPGKDVIFHVNSDLLFGIKITDNDIVYDMNLQRTLDAIEDYIEQQYD